MDGIELIPSAKRIIKSLRDMGYDFSQAVADIIDNSIEAGAHHVAIDIEFDGDDSSVRISDDGRGMKPEELREAMRYGSEREYSGEDLGKFGLGLKTASMSQCQRLSVASRWNPERADISAYCWDLDHILKTNRWEILPLERTGLGPAIRSPLKDTTGTVVLWERLDRILGYKLPYGEAARKRLTSICRELEEHLGMVFHRFLSGQVRGKRLDLYLNGNQIMPWDPFCPDEPKTQALEAFALPIDEDGASGKVLFQPYILPHRDDFTSLDAFNRASGPASWNHQQGLYIYRADRLIQSGGWSNLRAMDEHTKLARVSVDVSPSLDEAFKINVAKMRVQMPGAIRETVKTHLTTITKLAREVYDRKAPRVSTSANPRPIAPTPPMDNPERRVASPGAQSPLGTNSVIGEAPRSPSQVLTIQEWFARALDVATASERPVLEAILTRLLKQSRQ